MKEEIKFRVKGILELNFDNPNFSIDQLSKEIGLSRSQLHRKLKAETGLSTSLFIRQVKLEKASLLLTNTQLNISEVCYQIGFTSPQNFAKYFKEAYGLSPSKYRQQLLIKDKQVPKVAAVIDTPTTIPPIMTSRIEKPFSKSLLPNKFTTFQLSTLLFLLLMLLDFGRKDVQKK